MRLSQSTRNGMINTTVEMLQRLENLCQTEYAKIREFQRQIEISQQLLNEKLEPEYIKCSNLLQSLKDKSQTK